MNRWRQVGKLNLRRGRLKLRRNRTLAITRSRGMNPTWYRTNRLLRPFLIKEWNGRFVSLARASLRPRVKILTRMDNLLHRAEWQRIVILSRLVTFLRMQRSGNVRLVLVVTMALIIRALTSLACLKSFLKSLIRRVLILNWKDLVGLIMAQNRVTVRILINTRPKKYSVLIKYMVITSSLARRFVAMNWLEIGRYGLAILRITGRKLIAATLTLAYLQVVVGYGNLRVRTMQRLARVARTNGAVAFSKVRGILALKLTLLVHCLPSMRLDNGARLLTLMKLVSIWAQIRLRIPKLLAIPRMTIIRGIRYINLLRSLVNRRFHAINMKRKRLRVFWITLALNRQFRMITLDKAWYLQARSTHLPKKRNIACLRILANLVSLLHPRFVPLSLFTGMTSFLWSLQRRYIMEKYLLGILKRFTLLRTHTTRHTCKALHIIRTPCRAETPSRATPWSLLVIMIKYRSPYRKRNRKAFTRAEENRKKRAVKITGILGLT